MYHRGGPAVVATGTRNGAPHRLWRETTPLSGELAKLSNCRFESNALSHPPGRWTIARHIGGNSLADERAHHRRFGGDHCVIARRADISAGQLKARAVRYPGKRGERHRQSECRPTFYAVARSTSQRLLINRCAPHKRGHRLVLFQRLGGSEPLPLFAWRRSNQVADGLVQTLDGLACCAPAKSTASKTCPKCPGVCGCQMRVQFQDCCKTSTSPSLLTAEASSH